MAMEMKPKKIPMRQCMGCGEHFPKKELLRVVRTPEGVVELDFTGKKNGRGAYLCHSVDCLKKAIKTRKIERELEVSLSAQLYQALQDTLNAALEAGMEK